MKTLKYLQLMLFAALLTTGIACVTQATSGSNAPNDKFTVKINSSEAGVSPRGLKIEEVGNSDTPPAIFNYINGSDYVVLAQMEKTDAVAKFGKTESNDMQDLMAGLLHTFKIEKMLYAKDSLNPIEAFQVFVPMDQRMKEYYKIGQKYLIFLRGIARDESVWTSYELDKSKTYFRAFEAENSIFPGDGGMHGSPKKGIIDISDTRYKDLIKRIESLSEALRAEDKDSKIVNLKVLAQTTDEELKANALYAIKVLQKEEN